MSFQLPKAYFLWNATTYIGDEEILLLMYLCRIIKQIKVSKSALILMTMGQTQLTELYFLHCPLILLEL